MFKELGLIEVITNALAKLNFASPSEIQEKAIPQSLQGQDIICQAHAGTGKTLCYLTTILQLALQIHSNEYKKQMKIMSHNDGNIIQDIQKISPFCIVIVPTRELALQVMDLLTRLTQNILESYQTDAENKKLFYELLNEVLAPKLFIGGLPIEQDRDILRLKRCSIMVGTLGRIMQLLQENILTLHNIRLVVLDEADKLFENQQFQANFKKIMNSIIGKNEENISPQILTYSATYPPKQLTLIKSVMKHPVFISTVASLQDNQDLSLPNLKQYYIQIQDDPKKSKYETKVECILALIKKLEFQQAIIFYNDKHRGENLFNDLRAEGYIPIFIHGDLSQSDRIKVMHQMRRNKVNLIISTDLLSRGIDIDTLDIVLHFDTPSSVETYFHRIGRTGRFGTFGLSFLLLHTKCEYEWVDLWKEDYDQVNQKFRTKHEGKEKKKDYFAQFLNGVSNWRDKDYQFYDETKFKYKEDEQVFKPEKIKELTVKSSREKKDQKIQLKQQICVDGAHESIELILKCNNCKQLASHLQNILGKPLKIQQFFQ